MASNLEKRSKKRQAFQRWMLMINNKYLKDEKQMLAAYKKIK
jgi:hypothetical protein|tara:strand:+ start:161 stop:286 length:126 start_codon:yes stop_codon:yes gene_type:complete